MSVAVIRQWLKDPRSFERGRDLYLQYGQSSILKKRLEQGESTYARTRLQEELKALADRSERFEVPPSMSTPEAKAVPREQLPPHL